MPDELIDIYDENNKFLGISRMKSEAHQNGLWHRAAHVWEYWKKISAEIKKRFNKN